MGVKIKRKILFEADEQQTQNNNAFNGTDIINKILALQVDTITALQGVYKNITQNIPELQKAATDTASPINKETKEFADSVNKFIKAQVDASKADTITAAMGIYSEIAEKLKILINKVVEVTKAQQPAQAGQQQQAQPAQGEQQAQTTQQPAQPAQQAESVRFNTFGSTLNEKIRAANFNKMMNSIVL